MIDKMMQDFIFQKQFTENASHEMQTPLAVIRNKIELLIQSENLNKTESDLILSINDAVSKLSRLNKSLLLLAKIENHQFKGEADISLVKIIDESLLLFEDHLAEKNIKVIKAYHDNIKLFINPDLCMVFVNNLMQNAIRHNTQNGSIEILLDKNHFSISNTGKALAIDPSKIFQRFQKDPGSIDSTGLGLAIAKEIAVASGLTFEYDYWDLKHNFSLKFKG